MKTFLLFTSIILAFALPSSSQDNELPQSNEVKCHDYRWGRESYFVETVNEKHRIIARVEFSGDGIRKIVEFTTRRYPGICDIADSHECDSIYIAFENGIIERRSAISGELQGQIYVCSDKTAATSLIWKLPFDPDSCIAYVFPDKVGGELKICRFNFSTDEPTIEWEEKIENSQFGVSQDGKTIITFDSSSKEFVLYSTKNGTKSTLRPRLVDTQNFTTFNNYLLVRSLTGIEKWRIHPPKYLGMVYERANENVEKILRFTSKEIILECAKENSIRVLNWQQGQIHNIKIPCEELSFGGIDDVKILLVNEKAAVPIWHVLNRKTLDTKMKLEGGSVQLNEAGVLWIRENPGEQENERYLIRQVTID